MKLILIGANGKIGELVQKALAGAGHEIVKVGHKSGDFLVEIENRESVRKLYQAVGSFDAVAIAAGQVHLLRFRNSPLKSGSFRWEANSWVRSIWFRRRSRSSGNGMKARPDETLTISAPLRVLRCGKNCCTIRTGPFRLISISRVTSFRSRG